MDLRYATLRQLQGVRPVPEPWPKVLEFRTEQRVISTTQSVFWVVLRRHHIWFQSIILKGLRFWIVRQYQNIFLLILDVSFEYSPKALLAKTLGVTSERLI